MRKVFQIAFLILLFNAAAGADSVNVTASDGELAASRTPDPAVRLTIIERYEYYEINGCCEKDLRCDLSRKGCRWDDGKMYDSVTNWAWEWEHAHHQAQPAVCAPNAIELTLEITFRYPRWARTADAPASLERKWNEYLKNLEAHEKGHRDMAVAAAEGFSRAVAALPPAASCYRLDRMVHALSREWMDRLKADAKTYDQATNHGVTQGALFP